MRDIQLLCSVIAWGLLAACPAKPVDDNVPEDSTSGGEAGTTAIGLPGTGEPSTGAPGEDASSTGSETGFISDPTPDTTPCGGFVCPYDMGPEIPQCDPMAQDCPAGQKCVWYAEPGETTRRGTARCVAVVGDLEPFAPCSLPNGVGPDVTDDCGADSYCLNARDVTDHGFCAPYPQPGTIDCAHLPGTSYLTENGSIFPHACLFLNCNPLAPTTCPDGLRCTHYPASLYGSLSCWPLPEDVLPVGAACDYDECGAGKLCLPAEFVPGCVEDRCCTEWCDLSAPACSDGAASCDPAAEDPGPGLETLGVCVVPGSLGP